MDERELETLFSGAPEAAPPPTFTKDDVVRESKRQTQRRRNRITAGAGAFVLVVVGFGTYGLVSGPGDRAAVMNSAVAPAQPGASAARPLGTGNGEAPNFSARPSQQGDSGTVKTGPRVEGASGCEKVDWELATALAGELPGHFTAGQASPGSVCTTGTRSAGFPLSDGMISAAVFARGAPVNVPPQPADAVTVRQTTGSGGTLVLAGVPGTAGSPAPYAADLARFAAALAPRF
ncbi:hypothetical protein [Amycolatopsis saalfeldensis]|uniref:Uncharacterized protein n=1 Tax=Amycolatopsis saalfeldensis TaxID=394193 RepID=A0A1H8YJK1_9PSEU|nr:hypothetical protein [Amycolatopsis saalfeldensis]SEP52232.1 hypothetical protein SAMN04489732_119114 [Amycolatopsis saalfeldensis]